MTLLTQSSDCKKRQKQEEKFSTVMSLIMNVTCVSPVYKTPPNIVEPVTGVLMALITIVDG